ncbi:MAG: Smr/MutS family protein [Acidithiobacillus sp.]|uniref:Smr/MutS family protein n=1 Tax=Acidithiobacillus ferruginosus TaxID=3063951 RepID=A0ACD5ILB8_9PROT|nr:Smr/MutS family protein [Acidithiobacillus ferruginosus]
MTTPDPNTHPVQTPIDGVLDLHTFCPQEVPDLVREYLHACRIRHITKIRIIHGKGKGVLRETVHAILRREPMVRGFHLANDRGSWGATLVDIYPPNVSLPPRRRPEAKAHRPGPVPGWYRLLHRIFARH